MVNTKQKLTLILHIGAGKTGTSSIQESLNKNKDLLKDKGVTYVGLMLENVKRLYDWQRPSHIEVFHNLPQSEIDTAIYKIFQEIITSASKNNIHTILWSNESFFNRSDKLFPVLQRLQEEGLEIKFVAYLRRFDTWAKSAYIQWGIKHKTTKGKILTFSQWIETRMPLFHEPLERLEKVFPNQLSLRNMDATKDVVKDFYQLFQLETDDILPMRMNKSPNNEELFLRTIFNNHFHAEVLPKKFDNNIAKNITVNQTPTEYLQSYLPTDSNLEDLLLAREEDRKHLNILLSQSQQLALGNKRDKTKKAEVNTEKLIMALSEIVLAQSHRISKLEKVLLNSGDKYDL